VPVRTCHEGIRDCARAIRASGTARVPKGHTRDCTRAKRAYQGLHAPAKRAYHLTRHPTYARTGMPPARVCLLTYLQMGKLYKRLGNLGAAQRQLETALSLNSTSSADAGLIKVAIEKLGVNDDEEEEEL